MRILIVRTDRIGDVLLSTPVLSLLREFDADCHISMLVSQYAAGAIEGHPALNEVIIDEFTGKHRGPRGFFRLVSALSRRRFDAALVLHPTVRLALACRLAGISERIGTGYRLYGPLFNRRVYEHRKDASKHEVEYNLQMVRALFDTSVINAPVVPQIAIPEDAHRRVVDRMRQWRVRRDDRLVVLHPGSGGSARNWPPESFAALAARLVDSGVRVVVTSSPEEQALANLVAKSRSKDGVIVAGSLGVKELAALLTMSTVCITNSTGPLHIAAAVGTPTVALFCPIKPCSPRRWGPYGENHDVLMPDVPSCPRCIETACPYFDCMKRITVDDVFETVNSRLSITHSRALRQNPDSNN